MFFPFRNRSGGFTYLAALIMIIIMGIMLGAIGQRWSTVMKREREEELLFRGKQMVDAIGKWYKPKTGRHLPTGLKELKDLLKDPRELSNVRHLRRLYTDPITGKEWKVITGPVKGLGATNGIIGVASTSDEEPLRQKNFVEMFSFNKDETDLINMFKSFDGKTKYSEWQFVYGTAQQAGSVIPPKSPFLPG